MAIVIYGNGHARRGMLSNFSVNGKFIVSGGALATKMYSIGDLWGSVTIRFNGLLTGSDVKVIKTSDDTILANVPSSITNQEVTIDWFYPPDTNNIQIIITKAGYYFINSTLDLEYSSSTIIFLIDQIEVAVGVDPNDIAAAVWDYLSSSVTVDGSMGVIVNGKLLKKNDFIALKGGSS